MKNLILNFLFTLCVIPVFAQIDDAKMTEIGEQQIKSTATARMTSGNVDCRCEQNILKDGGFQNLTNSTTPPLSNIGATSSPWHKGTLTPQWTNAAAACNTGFVSMWGNEAVGESITQNATIPAGTYNVKFTARYANPNSIGYVRLKIKVNGTAVYTSVNISSTTWATYTASFTTTGGSVIELMPTNQHNVNNGAYVSWIQLDNICIERGCDCKELPQQFAISGVKNFCKPKTCNTNLTYTAPNLDPKCYKYSWAVSPSVAFTGQGTNHINLACAALNPGTYTIAVKINCGDKTVSSTFTLVVCAKLDPSFTMATNGSGVAMVSSVSAAHYWLLFKDNDNSCGFSAGDALAAPISTANPANFTGLANNQQYVIYHFVYNSCGNNFGCWSLQIMCFKYLPPMKVANGAPTVSVQKVSERVIENYKDIPQDVLRQLPQDMKAHIEHTESAGKE